jgi:Tfp pilus assembly protein FimT
MQAHRSRFSTESGYSLVELLIVVGLIAVAGGMTAAMLPSAKRTAAADGEMQRIVATMRGARDLAVSSRRNVIVAFPSRQLTVAREERGATGAVTGTTPITTLTLEGGFDYRLFTGLPDTPDAFGTASATSFSGATSVLFTPEGDLVDQTSDPVNGTLFIGRQGETASARAITVLGVTGLVTGYRWDGGRWVR